MAASALHNPLPSLRMWLAEITRSGGNPNHDAQGRFAPGAGKPVPDVVVQQGETGGKYARLIARAERGETVHMQCAHCSRMLNGPYAGKRLGVVVRKDDWSHGMCLKCHHDVLFDYYTKRWGMTSEQAERRIALQQAGEPIPDDLLTGAEKATASESERLNRLHAIRLFVAEVIRDYEYTDDKGNVHLVTQGVHGLWENNQIIVHGTGTGKSAQAQRPPVATAKPTSSNKRTGATKGSTTKTAGAWEARAQRDQEITAGLAAAQRYREASAQREQILRDLEVAKRDHPYDTHFADVFKEARHFADVVATRRQALAAMNKVARSLSQDERAMLRQRIQNHPSYYTPKEQSIDDLLRAASSQDTKRIVRESKKGVSQRVAIPTLAAIRATLHSIA